VVQTCGFRARGEGNRERGRYDVGDAPGAGAKGFRDDFAIRRHDHDGIGTAVGRSGHVSLGSETGVAGAGALALRRQQELRYGENPHQAAALYVPAGRRTGGSGCGQAAPSKELSYNNLVDLEAARSLAAEFKNPAAVIIKHNNPCGTAEQGTLLEAYLKALACDPVLGVRRRAGVQPRSGCGDGGRGRETFCGMHRSARFCGPRKGNFRGQEKPAAVGAARGWPGAGTRIAAQAHSRWECWCSSRISAKSGMVSWRTVTKRAPTTEEMHTMRFAWKVAKHVKSNAIVFAKDGATLGVGAGQMSRVDSVKIAVMKAQSSLAGTVVASDAFFPFP